MECEDFLCQCFALAYQMVVFRDQSRPIASGMCKKLLFFFPSVASPLDILRALRRFHF